LNKLDTDRRMVALSFCSTRSGRKNRVCRAGTRAPCTFSGSFLSEDTRRQKRNAGQKKGERVRAPRFLSRLSAAGSSHTNPPSVFIPHSIHHFVSFPPFTRPSSALLLSFAVLFLQFLLVYLSATSFIPS